MFMIFQNLKTKRGVDDSGAEGSPQPDNQALTPAQLLHSYLIYVRLSKTIDRYLLMIDQLRSGTTSSSGNDAQKQQATADEDGKQKGKRKKQKDDSAASEQTAEKMKAKPLDLVRLYDTVLQVSVTFHYLANRILIVKILSEFIRHFRFAGRSK
jgi:hypothetical protein